MDLLGKSLEDLMNYCNRKFSVKTTTILANQLISRLEFIHSKKYIHRDVKPDNFLIGTQKKKHLIYVIDFGLSKKYIDPKTNTHIPYKDGKSLTGTVRYASLNTHMGIEQSRRDDLESLGYCLIYFLISQLPWQGMKAKGVKEKYEKIYNKKKNTSLESLIGNNPKEFADFVKYCRDLKFDEKPDYNYLKKLMLNVINREKYVEDSNFDWVIKEKEEKEKEKEKKTNEEKKK